MKRIVRYNNRNVRSFILFNGWYESSYQIVVIETGTEVIKQNIKVIISVWNTLLNSNYENSTLKTYYSLMKI